MQTRSFNRLLIAAAVAALSAAAAAQAAELGPQVSQGGGVAIHSFAGAPTSVGVTWHIRRASESEPRTFRWAE
jgi:hypothetical protein